jgi:hypothetical protein
MWSNTAGMVAPVLGAVLASRFKEGHGGFFAAMACCALSASAALCPAPSGLLSALSIPRRKCSWRSRTDRQTVSVGRAGGRAGGRGGRGA